MITFVQLELSGKKLPDLPMEKLLELENKLTEKIKSTQIKK